jgi:hypothetical protein
MDEMIITKDETGIALLPHSAGALGRMIGERTGAPWRSRIISEPTRRSQKTMVQVKIANARRNQFAKRLDAWR